MKQKPWWRDSDEVDHLKTQISMEMMKQGLAFFHTKEYAELHRMLEEVRAKEKIEGA